LCNKYRHHSKTDIQRKTCTAHYSPYLTIQEALSLRLNAHVSACLSVSEVKNHFFSEQKRLNNKQKMMNKFKRRCRDLERIIRKIVEQNALNEITPETFSKLYSDYIKEQDDLLVKINSLEANIIAEHGDAESMEQITLQLKTALLSGELSRESILDFIDIIAVYEPTGNRREGTREQTIEIHYRFSREQ